MRCLLFCLNILGLVLNLIQGCMSYILTLYTINNYNSNPFDKTDNKYLWYFSILWILSIYACIYTIISFIVLYQSNKMPFCDTIVKHLRMPSIFSLWFRCYLRTETRDNVEVVRDECYCPGFLICYGFALIIFLIGVIFVSNNQDYINIQTICKLLVCSAAYFPCCIMSAPSFYVSYKISVETNKNDNNQEALLYNVT